MVFSSPLTQFFAPSPHGLSTFLLHEWRSAEVAGCTALHCTPHAFLQDGKTTSEEVLRAMVLDGAVDDDAVDADVFDVFDK